jgi:uncharacterized membrane protein YdjX (TVP38/TMEM64 family)
MINRFFLQHWRAIDRSGWQLRGSVPRYLKARGLLAPTDRLHYSLVTTAFAAWTKRAAIFLLVVLFLAVPVVLGMEWQSYLSFEALMNHRERLEAWAASRRWEAFATYVAIYALAAGLSMPGVVFFTMAGGVLFGWLLGGLAAILGATFGGSLVFLLAKTSLGDLVRRWAEPHAERFAAGFREDAFSYVLLMRIVPLFPFAMGNLLPALCGVGFGTFFCATLLGVVPMTMVFALLGASLDDAFAVQIAEYRTCLAASGLNCRVTFSIWTALSPKLMVAIVMLGIIVLIPVAMKRFHPPTARM